MRDRNSRHRAVRDAATRQVVVTAAQDSVKAGKVAAVLIKRCRTVLTERCATSLNYEVANTRLSD